MYFFKRWQKIRNLQVIKIITISSNDKAVIIWQYNPANDPKVTAELKYTHSEQVYCLSFNPLTS